MPPLLDGHERGDRLRRYDHAAHVLREVTREAVDLGGQPHQVAPEGGVYLGAELRQARHLLRQVAGMPGVDPLRQLVQLRLRQPQRLAHVADGGAQLVGDDLAHQRRVVRPELAVHPQDKRLPDVAGEVEVDVGHRRPLFIEEAPEEEAVAQGVDVGETDEIADERAH
jgi:hypothetical protein